MQTRRSCDSVDPTKARRQLNRVGKKPYRRNVGVVVFNREGKVLLGERVGYPGSLQFPQGGMDEGESPVAAARRELFEETGLSVGGEPVWEVPDWLRYDFPADIPRKLRKFRGQEQRWFFFYWDGDPDTLDLAHHEREFSRVIWGTLEEALDSIVSFKRHIYERIVREGRQQIGAFLSGR